MIAENTLSLLQDVSQTANGALRVTNSALQKIGNAEARGGSAFSKLERVVESTKPATWGGKLTGGIQTISLFVNRVSNQTQFVIHTVTDEIGTVVHQDFDAVRIASGQVIGKGK